MNIPEPTRAGEHADELTERNLLGAFLQNPPLLDRYGDLDHLLFVDSNHRELYRRMQDCWRGGSAIYPYNEMLAPGDSPEDTELRAILNDAWTNCPSDVMAPIYVNTLLELGRKRTMHHVLAQAAELNSNGTIALAVRDQLLTVLSSAEWEMTGDDAGGDHHPLNVERKSCIQLGWVDEYADVMTALTASPREFNVLGGLTLVATVVQRRACLRLSFGDIYPNLFGAVVAPSSVYHKSSSLAKPRAILKEAMLNGLLLSELQTSEGLLRQLQDKPAGLIIRDEIGTLFASHTTKYLSNLKPDLTALYDCYPYSRRLSQEEITVKEPYLNILGATTPARFFEGVSLTDWQDGFLARWLFVMPGQEPDFDIRPRLFTRDDEIRMQQLASWLTILDKEPRTDFVLESDSFELWTEWEIEGIRRAYYYNDDVITSIVSRYSTYALKFSLILATARDSWGIITPEIMQTAIDLTENFKATVFRLLSLKANHGVSGGKLQKVFEIIRHAGSSGITTKVIYQRANMTRGECQPVLDKLCEIGACRSDIAGNGFRYFACTDRLPIKAW